MSIAITGRAARVGWQHYATGPEYRDATEVFAPKSLASWVGIPVTIGHPQSNVDASTVARLAVGYVKSVRRDGDHVLADIVLRDGDAIARVESGELVEFSAGYSTNVDDQGWQRDIIINHVALLPSGAARCGSSCSLVSR